MDPLRFNKREHGIDERSKALELSLRSHLSASELEEHYGRKARLVQDANDRRAKIDQFLTMEESSTPPALRRCIFPPSMGTNGSDNARPWLFEGVPQQWRQRPAPRAPHEDPELREDWKTSLDQRGYVEFEIADQKRRLARMGLVGRDSRGDETTFSSSKPKPDDHVFARTWAPKEKPAQTTLSPPIPMPTNHHCGPKETFVPQMWVPPKAQEQQSKTPACRGWIQQVPVLKSKAGQDVEQRKLAEQRPAEQKPLEQKPAQQKREQQQTRLPAAKPGNLYPGPTRIPSTLPPNHILHEDDIEQNRISERALSELHKTKLASLEVIRQLKEAKERKDGEQQRQQQQQQHKATLSASRPEATKRESVKQLLAGVNRALEQKVEVAQGGAARTERVEKEKEAFQILSQQPHKGPEDAFVAGLKCGRKFWDKYDKSYPIPGQSPDRPTGSEFARHTGTSRGEVPHDSSRTSDLRAAVEAIDRTSGHPIGVPKTASDQDKTPCLEPSSVIIAQNKVKDGGGIADISVVAFKDHPAFTVPRQDAPVPLIPCAEQTNMSTEPEEDDGGVEDAVENVPLGDLDIHSDWEEVEHSVGNDGWSDFEQDFASNDWKDSSSSMDMEWASDVVSEGCV